MLNAQMMSYAPATRDMRSDYERDLEQTILARRRIIAEALERSERDAKEITAMTQQRVRRLQYFVRGAE